MFICKQFWTFYNAEVIVVRTLDYPLGNLALIPLGYEAYYVTMTPFIFSLTYMDVVRIKGNDREWKIMYLTLKSLEEGPDKNIGKFI